MNLPTYITGNVHTRAHRLLRERVCDVLAQYELTPTYWSMLGAVIQCQDGIRQVEIARMLHVKAPLITAMSQQLETKGLIQSVRNQFDARAKLLAITPEGKKFAKSVDAALTLELQMLLKGLTDSELRTYNKVLTTIIANDEADKKQG